MNIVGLQKLTLLDFPGKVACTVFLGGCNFRCPFCHNSQLLENPAPIMEQEELLDYLKSRTGILDGVCITGGEPTLQPDLEELLTQIKALGFAVKLDTNGYRPQVLKSLVEQGLVDYVAMDIKNGPEDYPATTGVSLELSRIEESIRFLMSGAVDYEFRTTVVEPLHTERSIEAMAHWLTKLGDGKKAAKLYLQPFVDRDTVAVAGLAAPQDAVLALFAQILAPCASLVEIRGI